MSQNQISFGNSDGDDDYHNVVIIINDDDVAYDYDENDDGEIWSKPQSATTHSWLWPSPQETGVLSEF